MEISERTETASRKQLDFMLESDMIEEVTGCKYVIYSVKYTVKK